MKLKSNWDFTGKVAYIIGGGGHIGGVNGIAGAFAAGGADIALGDIDPEKLKASAEYLRNEYGVKVNTYEVNILDPDTIYKACDQVVADFGHLDIFAQVASPSASAVGDKGPFYGVPMEAAETMVTADLLGTGHACKAALKYMLPQKYGRILIVASQTGRYGTNDFVWYGAAKAGLIHLTQSIACSHGKEGITCNGICPGVVISPLLRKRFEIQAAETNGAKTAQDFEDELVAKLIPEGKAQTAADMGYAAAFLCSDLAEHINGQTLNVCGTCKLN